MVGLVVWLVVYTLKMNAIALQALLLPSSSRLPQSLEEPWTITLQLQSQTVNMALPSPY